MKADTDQLLNLIKSVPVLSIEEVCEDIKNIYDVTDGAEFLKMIARVQLYLPTGTVFRIAGLELLLKKTHILIIAGNIDTGNVVVAVDKAALDLERVLFSRIPNIVGVVKSISFPNINKPKAMIAISEIVSNYQDMVMKTRLGLIGRENLSNTLLNSIFEYVMTGRVIPVIGYETFD